MCAWRVACIRKGGHTWRTRRAILWGSSSWDCRDFGCGGCGRNKLRKEKETRRCGEGKKRRKKVSCCCWLPLTMYKSACYHTVPSSLLPGTPGSGSPIQPGRPRFHPFLTWCKIKRFTFSSLCCTRPYAPLCPCSWIIQQMLLLFILRGARVTREGEKTWNDSSSKVSRLRSWRALFEMSCWTGKPTSEIPSWMRPQSSVANWRKKREGKGVLLPLWMDPCTIYRKANAISPPGVSHFVPFFNTVPSSKLCFSFHQLNVLRCYSGTPTPPLPNLQRVDVEGQLEKAVLQAVRGIRFVSIVFSTITF